MLPTLPPVTNRHLVRELDRGRIRELLLVVALVVLLLLPLLAYVWNHMEWIRVGYEMEQLKREKVVQAEMGDRLRIEKASLSSLARVEREARERLGLIPSEGAVVQLEQAAPASVAKAAAPAPAPAQDDLQRSASEALR